METPEKESGEVAQAANSVGTSATWAFLRENFSVISGGAVVSGITLAIVFLFSYLSAFSWRLIELIQYVDVITFGVIAAGIVSGSIISITNIVESWLRLRTLKTRGEKRVFIIVLCVVAAAIFGLYLWAEIRAKNEYMHTVYGAVLIGMTVFGLVAVVRQISAGQKLTAAFVLNYAIFAILLTGFAGQWLAYTVQERSDFDQDVLTKSKEFKSAKVVMIMCDSQSSCRTKRSSLCRQRTSQSSGRSSRSTF
jgi:hypothetical protein